MAALPDILLFCDLLPLFLGIANFPRKSYRPRSVAIRRRHRASLSCGRGKLRRAKQIGKSR